MVKFKPNLEKTNKVLSTIAAVALNLAVIGVSAVIVKSSVDTLCGTKIRNKIRDKIANFKLRRQMKKAKVVGPDAPKKTEPVLGSSSEKKPAKKKVSKPAEVDRPEDLPAPEMKSQE